MTTGPETDPTGSLPVALLRITLGVIVLVTWWGNLGDDLYTADGLEGFFNWLDAPPPDGNGSSFGPIHGLFDLLVVPAASFLSALQLVVELLLGICLLTGTFTRLAAQVAIAFFSVLLLAYLGGEEWIWTYVLLVVSSLTVHLGYGGRILGFDRLLVASRGDSPGSSIW